MKSGSRLFKCALVAGCISAGVVSELTAGAPGGEEKKESAAAASGGKDVRKPEFDPQGSESVQPGKLPFPNQPAVPVIPMSPNPANGTLPKIPADGLYPEGGKIQKAIPVPEDSVDPAIAPPMAKVPGPPFGGVAEPGGTPNPVSIPRPSDVLITSAPDPNLTVTGTVMPNRLYTAIVNTLNSRGVRNWAVGGIIGIMDQRGRRYYAAFGEKRLNSGEVPDADTVFQLASISKPMLGVLFARLEELGMVNSNEFADAYLDFRMPQGGNGQRITLRHLMQHTSGLESQVPALGGYRLSQEQLRYYLSSSPPLAFDPGSPGQSRYSNMGAAVLAYIAERLHQNRPYDEILRQYVLEPLGMLNTSHNGSPPANRSYRYVRNVSNLAQVPTNQTVIASGNVAAGARELDFEDFTGLYAGGGIRSSAADMLSFLGAHFQAQGLPPNNHLSTATQWARVWPLFWNQVGTSDLVRHNGNILGVRTSMAVDMRLTQTAGVSAGIVMLVNTSLELGPGQSYAIFNPPPNTRLNYLGVSTVWAVDTVVQDIWTAINGDPSLLR